MGRRAIGEGTTYFDDSKKIWIYQISYRDENGVRQRKKFKAKIKREAMRKGKAFLEESALYCIYQLIRSGQLKAYKNPGGRAWLIPEQSIRDYIESRIHLDDYGG